MRVFWLGAHKVLVHTELKRLRQLGFEVFNPPYLSGIQDQSAQLDWDYLQPTTLPKDVFEKLRRYNFFYNPVTAEIAKILNEYFDAVIVTIREDWLAEILRVYNGKVIFRTYGQNHSLSEELWNNDALQLITERNNFWFVPHSANTIEDEHKWLRDREIVVPYVLPEDVFVYKDQWDLERISRSEIMVSCPNIDNSFFYQKYVFLKENFPDDYFKYYGVQLRKINDPHFVGTLEREEYLKRYLDSIGYLYFYTEPNVCYLPPIEMMVIGGPVIFMKGSLLDKYFQSSEAPGLASDPVSANIKCKRILSRDKIFIKEVIESQKKVRELYSQEYVWPKFDSVFCNLLSLDTSNKASCICHTAKQKPVENKVQNIYLLHHFPDAPVSFHQGIYSAYDGIPRVMRLIVHALCEQTDCQIIVTCRRDQLVNFYGFFSTQEHVGRVKMMIVEKGNVFSLKRKLYNLFSRYLKRVKNKIRSNALCRFIPKNVFGFVFYIFKGIKKTLKQFLFIIEVFAKKLSSTYIQTINRDPFCAGVIIPHYYAFSESALLTKPVVLYLPDYLPYFFAELRENEELTSAIGRKIAKISSAVITNSHFSKDYLPNTKIMVDKKKIHVFYLPNLNESNFKLSKHSSFAFDMQFEKMQSSLDGIKYIFYPTQPRPNKNLEFLLTVFSVISKRDQSCKLVLTFDLSFRERLYRLCQSLGIEKKVECYPSTSDFSMRWLYSHSACLCLTSLMEGNFPPQIFEALEYKTPVIATNLPLVSERLGQNTDLLLLCAPSDLDDFVSKIEYAFENREEILNRQEVVLEILKEQSSWSQFCAGIKWAIKDFTIFNSKMGS